MSVFFLAYDRVGSVPLLPEQATMPKTPRAHVLSRRTMRHSCSQRAFHGAPLLGVDDALIPVPQGGEGGHERYADHGPSRGCSVAFSEMPVFLCPRRRPSALDAGVFLADVDIIDVDVGLALLGVLQLVMAIIVMYTMNPIGRKPLLLYGKQLIPPGWFGVDAAI